LYFEAGHNLNETDLTLNYERKNRRGQEQHNFTLRPHTRHEKYLRSYFMTRA